MCTHGCAQSDHSTRTYSVPNTLLGAGGHSEQNRHNPCPHEADSQLKHKEAYSQIKAGLIQQLPSYLRVNSLFSGTARRISDRMSGCTVFRTEGLLKE